MNTRKRSRPGASVGVAVFSLLSVWQALVIVFAVPSYVVPSPWETTRLLFDQWRYLLGHAAWTLTEALLGLGLAVTVGVGTAAIVAGRRGVSSGIVSLMAAAQAIPIVAIAPVLTLWFGGGVSSKCVMAALLCYFPFALALTRGLSQTQGPVVDLFRVYRATPWQEFTKLRLPAAVPSAMSGLRSSASLAMIGAIVAEYTGADAGLGYVVMQATYRVDTPMVFAAVFASAACGIALYGVVVLAERVLFQRFYRGLDLLS